MTTHNHSTTLPPRVDFAIIAANRPETKAVIDILGLVQPAVEPPVHCHWCQLDRKDGSKATVILVSMNDQIGKAEAIKETMEILSTIQPIHILLLGTAAGLCGNDTEAIKALDLVISYSVRSGPSKDEPDEPIREEALQQPSSALYSWANTVAGYEEWRDGKKAVHFTHFVSADGFLSMKEAEGKRIKNIRTTYPRAGAYEMEAGGIANALHTSSDNGWTTGYLVIKGVSDVPEKGDTPKDRKKNSLPAAELSAKFARDLIRDFVPQTRRPTPIKRILQPKLLGKVNNDCCGVLCDIRAREYSELAEHNLLRLSADMEDGCSFFAVCAFTPKDLAALVHEAPDSISEHQLFAQAHKEFPHFRCFSDMAKGSVNGHCVRVLLLDELEYWDSFTALQKKLFLELNGDVECWLGRKSFLKGDYFLTDYVVLGQTLVLDYYSDSCVLVVSDMEDKHVKDNLLGLRNHWRTECENAFSHSFRRLTGMKMDEGRPPGESYTGVK